MTLSTHVLDLTTGEPAAGLPVRVWRREPDADWVLVAEAVTDTDGRARALVPDADWRAGSWRLEVQTAGRSLLHPRVVVEVDLPDDRPCHLPVLLSAAGYTTYRGT